MTTRILLATAGIFTLSLFFVACGKKAGASDPKKASATSKSAQDKATGAPKAPAAAAKKAAPAGDPGPVSLEKALEGIKGKGKLMVKIETSEGTMVAELFEKKVPKTVANFVGLARGKRSFKDPKTRTWTTRPYYDGLTFHRVIPNFMIQGGCPLGTGTGGPGYKFEDEFDASLKHSSPGILSMANAGPNTNGSQFFVTEAPTPHLDKRHSVFGRLVKGLDIQKKIGRVKTGPGNRPAKPVVIKAMSFYRK